MLRYEKEKYTDGRGEACPTKLDEIMGKCLLELGIEVPETTKRRLVMGFLVNLVHHLFLNPQEYFDLRRFVLYRGSETENLLKIETKDDLNAEEIKNYFEDGGYGFIKINAIMNDFMKKNLQKK